MNRWRAIVGMAFALFASTAMAGEPLRLAVAGNFKPALERLLSEWDNAPETTLSTGATGKLYAQIRQGAPFDILLAADRDRPERLEADGLVIEGSRFTYAQGRLTLWSPKALDGDDLVTWLESEPPPRLALANPRLAPYGAAAEDFLVRRGLWDRLSPQAIRGESIAQAFQFTVSGNADLGLVAESQLRLSDYGQQGQSWPVPADLHAPIDQQAVLLRDTPAGRAFLAWLASPEVRSRLQDFGYDSP